MKKVFFLTALSLFTVFTVRSTAQDLKVKTICFDDAFGYHWVFNSLQDNGDGTYFGTGTVDNAYPSGYATLSVDTRNGLNNASVEVHGINAAPDGCAQYSDSFVYTGTAQINPGVSYSGSGTWQSYCFGGVINSGTWSAAGPCGTAPVKKDTKTAILPAMANHSSDNPLAAKQVCFSDGFGYVWNITSTTNNHNGTYSGSGTVTGAYPSGSATIYLDLRNGRSNAPVEIHGINNNPDGCTSYSDSFVYVGTAVISAGSFTMSGTWTSYCSGGVLNSGTWYAAGPCTSSTVKPDTKTPIPPARTNQRSFSITAIPNPVRNYTDLQYHLTTSGKINITVYDYMHQPVKTLVNESKTEGNYTTRWDARNASGSHVPPGLYMVVSTVNGTRYSTAIQVL